jgi:hypothetical protein
MIVDAGSAVLPVVRAQEVTSMAQGPSPDSSPAGAGLPGGEPRFDGEDFPIELTVEHREAFAAWLSERIEAIVAQAAHLSPTDREAVRDYLMSTELEDIVEEWLDAYSDADNLSDLAGQLRSGEASSAS